MADRYWVGGTANWDATAGTKWATTSGGAGGASVPTSADDVFFSSASTGTCTITVDRDAKSINCTGFTGTLTASSGIAVNLYGSLTLATGMTTNLTLGTWIFNSTGTIDSAGKTLGTVTLTGVGATITLGSALNIGGATLTLSHGTLDTSASNYAITCGIFSSTNTNTRTLTLNASTITCTSFVVGSGTFTLNAGTSQINVTSVTGTAGATFSSSVTFYNVSYTGATAGTRLLVGSNTYNNLTLTPTTGSNISQLAVSSNNTINGTFTCAGASAVRRCFVRQANTAVGSATATLTVATLSANDCDFRDIIIAGGAAGTAPTRAGDCGGNSGITFPAAKTVYRVGSGTTWAGLSSWATSSGGTGDDNNFPLPQDTAIIDNSSTAASQTISVYNISRIDCSSRTNALTLSYAAGVGFYGSTTYGSGITVSGTATQTYCGRGTMLFTTAGKTITFATTVNTPTGTFKCADALSSTNTMTLTQGTFDADVYNVTFTNVDVQGTNTKTLTMGSGLWTLSGTGNVWNANFTSPSNLTFNKGTANILLSDTTTAARTFNGATYTYNKLTIGGTTGTSTLTLGDGNSTFTLSELASTKTVAHTIQLPQIAGVSLTIDTWSVTGTAGNVVTVNSSAAGTQRTLNFTNVTSGIDYLSVTDIGVNQANRFYAGLNSLNGGNNTNVYFTANAQTKVVFITSGTSFTIPSDFSSLVSVETIGGGGGGARGQSGTSYATGGGGGAYAKVTSISGLSANQSITVQVGAGGTAAVNQNTAGGAGGNTYFNGTSLATSSVGAAGGSGGNVGNPTSGGAGGLASSSVGTTKYDGGRGGSVSNATAMGGGGGAAGGYGVGWNGGSGALAAGHGTPGGGGGGGGLGSAGGSGTGSAGGAFGAGGNGPNGTGGGATTGANGTAGTSGGGAGATGVTTGNGTNAGSGATGSSFTQTSDGAIAGAGGGGGCGGSSSAGSSTGGNAGSGGLYGGGGGAAGPATTQGTAGAGAQGIIVFTYATAAVTNTGSMFFVID